MDVDSEVVESGGGSDAAGDAIGSRIPQSPRRPSTSSTAPQENHASTDASEAQQRDGFQHGNGLTAAQRLPREIIAQILYHADANSFASLIFVNRAWWQAGQSAQLYAHHLSRCPSYSACNNALPTPSDDSSLRKLRQKFHSEIKRNLFEVFLRPKETVIELLSSTTSSSVAFPGGEAFHFAFSHSGHLLLAYNSSRIYILDLTTETVTVKRELKILRRPASVAIVDDSSKLAVLSTDHQINVYDLRQSPARHIRNLALDNPPRTVALSPSGSVLAAAYQGGIEVYSLAADALATDRRGVRCDPVDALYFSADETLLLGTTLESSPPSTVVLSAPYYNEGQFEESTGNASGQIWTTQILFPNSNRECGHAMLLSSVADGDASWIFTHDQTYEASRAVRVEDVKSGTTFFPRRSENGSAAKLPPSTLPATSDDGELVSTGFEGREIWLWGIPEDLDMKPHPSRLEDDVEEEGNAIIPGQDANGSEAREQSSPSPRRGREREDVDKPQWQTLCDRFRDSIIDGRHVADFEGVSALKWVSPKGRGLTAVSCQRLVAVAPTGFLRGNDNEHDKILPADGGRIALLDFQLGITNGEKSVATIEIGDEDAEVLEEEDQDMETRVATVRRRTTAPRPHSVALLGSSSSTPPHPPKSDGLLLGSAAIEAARRSRRSGFLSSNDVSFEEAQDALDAPYDHTQPRSRSTLHRSATAVAANRRYHPSSSASGRVELRRPGGRGEIPDESDADHWVPPPPPYQPDAEMALPSHLQISLMPRSTEPVRKVIEAPSLPIRAQTTLEGMAQGATQRNRDGLERASTCFRRARSRRARDRAPSQEGNTTLPLPPELARGVAAVSVGPDTEDLYSSSPPGTPTGRTGGGERPLSANFAVGGSPTGLHEWNSMFPPAQPQAEHTEPRLPTTQEDRGLNAQPTAVEAFSSQSGDGGSNRSASNGGSRPSVEPSPNFHAATLPSSPSAEQLASLSRRSSQFSLQSIQRTRSTGHLPPDRPFNTAPPSTAPIRAHSNHPQPRNPSLPDTTRPQSVRMISAYAENSTLQPTHIQPLRRLDTIHSVMSRVTSSRSKRTNNSTSPRRRLSRAERSAAINVKLAKRQGWASLSSRDGRSKKRAKGRSRASRGGGSSEAWTDVSGGSNPDDPRGRRRCIIM